MHFDIPPDINPGLLGLNWLLGIWEGNGHGNWPDVGDFEYGQRIEFSSNGGAFLHYISQLWTLDDAGQPAAPLTMETGFWLPHDDATLDVLITHPEGWVELWAGRVQGGSISLTTDLVARVPSNPLTVTGGQRLYGNVEGYLMWTWDRASDDVALQPYLWGRLAKVTDDA